MRWLLIAVALTLFFVGVRQALRPVSPSAAGETDSSAAGPTAVPPTAEVDETAIRPPAAAASVPIAPAPRAERSAPDTPAVPEPPAAADEGPISRPYSVEDGVAVVDGDIAIGDAPAGSSNGVAQVSPVTPWPTHEIPYYIQPSLSAPERIGEALHFFDGTAVAFVPVSNQRDVLVFQEASGACKSYMGRVGGKQPVFISPACAPADIAHELMHALGFIHEQNRTDRDRYVRVNAANIVSSAQINFEKFPEPYMVLSGLAPFDGTSLMMYPPTMYSSNGQATMTALDSARAISPLRRLSPSDVARVNAYYSSK